MKGKSGFNESKTKNIVKLWCRQILAVFSSKTNKILLIIIIIVLFFLL